MILIMQTAMISGLSKYNFSKNKKAGGGFMKRTIRLYNDMGLCIPCEWDSEDCGSFVEAVERIAHSGMMGRSNVYLDHERQAIIYSATNGRFIIPQEGGEPKVY